MSQQSNSKFFNSLTTEEQLTIFELVLQSLRDELADGFMQLAQEEVGAFSSLDLSDEFLIPLRDKLDAFMENRDGV